MVPEPVHYVYDTKDRLVAEQDGKMRTYDPNYWKIYKYDVFNRIVIEGFFYSMKNREELQQMISDNTFNFQPDEEPSPINYAQNHGYTDNAFPWNDSCKIHHVYYYDNYDFNADGNSSFSDFYLNNFSDPATEKVTGLQTGQKSISFWPGDTIFEVTYYDNRYRIVQSAMVNHTRNQAFHTGNDYSFPGHVLGSEKRYYSQGQLILTYQYEYDYDHDWRPTTTSLSINGNPSVTLNTIEYYENGMPGNKYLHGNSQNNLYSLSHSYNIRGWLTGINTTANTELFGLRLFYDSVPDEALGYATAQFNGNISAILSRNQEIGVNLGGFAYKYDGIDRLKEATYFYKDQSEAIHYSLDGCNANNDVFIKGTGSVRNLSYDKNGNILSLTRLGRTLDGWKIFDSLSYVYKGNRLKAVDDVMIGQTNLMDFHDAGLKYSQHGKAEYEYDANGNMTLDLNRSLHIQYNTGNNLPRRIIHPQGSIVNHYTLGGAKLGKMLFDRYDNLTYHEQYYSDLVIKDGQPTRILHGDGTINLNGSNVEYHYHLKDHLGNVRLVITPDGNNQPVVLQANDYYPFGMAYNMNFQSGGGAHQPNKYLYNSKEEQEMPGKWLDYGWRMYDAQLGRWHGVDNMSEQRYWLSPFNYVQNNPIIRIDPDGNIDWEVVGRGALITTGGVASLAAAAFITPTGIGIPAAGYMGAQGIAGVSFGISTMVIGFASESSQETKDLAKSMPTDFNDLAAITYEKHTGKEGGNARTIAQGTSILSGVGLTKLAPSLPNAIKTGSALISGSQAALMAVDEISNTKGEKQENDRRSGSTTTSKIETPLFQDFVHPADNTRIERRVFPLID